MILLIDAGNTRIKWGRLTPGETQSEGACPTADKDCLAKAWQGLRARAAVISCVAGEAERAALLAQPALQGIPVHWLVAEARGHGLVSHYQPPESLGSDRYAALIAASRRLGLPCLVVGVGTAITVDMLGIQGEFLGGCIAPGPTLMRDALRRGTARVDSREPRWSDYPRDTETAVGTGIYLAQLGLISSLRERLQRHLGQTLGTATQIPPVVLSGGAAPLLRPFLEGHVIEAEALVLEGLAWVARDLGYVV